MDHKSYSIKFRAGRVCGKNYGINCKLKIENSNLIMIEYINNRCCVHYVRNNAIEQLNEAFYTQKPND